MTDGSQVKRVLPDPAAAAGWFAARLAYETDPSEVHEDLEAGVAGIVLVDARRRDAFGAGHLPGAISIPFDEPGAAEAAALPDGVLVVYGWGPACNAGTQVAHRLSLLGRTVKEMIGGYEGWAADGHPIEQVPG